jgi:hypothetical protein
VNGNASATGSAWSENSLPAAGADMRASS